jgi:hypothetical protein
VLLVIPLAFEALSGLRLIDRRERFLRLIAVAAAVVGCGLYAVWVWRQTGEFWFVVTIHDEFTAHVAGLLDLPIDFFREIGPDNVFARAIHLPFAAVFLAAGLVLIRRFPPAHAAFALVSMAVLLTWGMTAFERHAMSAFPVVIGLAWGARRLRLERAWLVVSAVFLVLFNGVAAYGWYVP